jgi:hypothetical protein
VSAAGFGAGPDQSRDQPLGRGGEQPLFEGIDRPALDCRVKEHVSTGGDAPGGGPLAVKISRVPLSD